MIHRIVNLWDGVARERNLNALFHGTRTSSENNAFHVCRASSHRIELTEFRLRDRCWKQSSTTRQVHTAIGSEHQEVRQEADDDPATYHIGWDGAITSQEKPLGLAYISHCGSNLQIAIHRE